jgi:hypothetical protein
MGNVRFCLVLQCYNIVEFANVVFEQWYRPACNECFHDAILCILTKVEQ